MDNFYWPTLAANEMLPEHIRGGLQRYVVMGIHPGGFLEAVLANDREEATARADEINKNQLDRIASFIHFYLSQQCYGSYAAVDQWVKLHWEKLSG